MRKHPYHLHLEMDDALIYELKVIAVTQKTTIRDIVTGLIQKFIIAENEKEGEK